MKRDSNSPRSNERARSLDREIIPQARSGRQQRRSPEQQNDVRGVSAISSGKSVSSLSPQPVRIKPSFSSGRLALVVLAIFGVAAALSTADVNGSAGGRRSGIFQQSYTPPVPTLSTPKSLTRLQAQTRSTFVLPSQIYDVDVETVSPVYDLGPVAASALSNVQDNQVGLSRKVHDDLDAGAAMIRNEDGTRIRLFSIKSQDAQALRLHFTGIDLPEGDQLFVYGQSADSHVAGPYTGKGPFGTGEFWADVVEGDTAVVEHLIASRRARSKVAINEVSHIFVSLDSSQFAPQLLSCEVDASCGNFPEKNAVARILFQDGGSFVCTGTLVNDRAQDQIPYFMTAAHCVSSEATAQTVEAFWFYQTTACNSGTLRQGSATSGMTLLATSAPADSTLLKMLTAPPAGVAFVGWDPNQRVAGTNVFGLHHPGGGIPPSTTSFLRSAAGSITDVDQNCLDVLLHGYLVTWTSGDTEPGSSGSALFASDGSGLIGTLSCGPSPASCSDAVSLYSRFSDFFPLAQPFLEGTGTTTCVTGLSPSGANFSSNGGNGNITVSAPGNCSWNAVASDSWITIFSGASGTGSLTISYTVAPNQTAAPRTGKISVQGFDHTITQAGLACSFTLNPTNRSFGPAGGSGSVDVTTGNGCSWGASSTVPWITITAGAAGTGNGTVQYNVSTNPGTNQRVGQIFVQGQSHTVIQNGTSCTFTLAPLGATLTANAGSGTINVTAPGGCSWTAVSSSSFLTITDGATGNGNGTVNYSIAPNPTPNARSGQILVADKAFVVTQAGAPVIQQAVRDLKNVIIIGLNFADGAQVLMDTVPQPKVKNDPANPTTRLIAKKLIKRIPKGQSVRLRVQNPDGSFSNEMTFLRPATVGGDGVVTIRLRPRPPGLAASQRRPLPIQRR